MSSGGGYISDGNCCSSVWSSHVKGSHSGNMIYPKVCLFTDQLKLDEIGEREVQIKNNDVTDQV